MLSDNDSAAFMPSHTASRHCDSLAGSLCGVAVLFLIFLAINRKELGQWFKKFLERVRHWDVMRSFYRDLCGSDSDCGCMGDAFQRG